MPIFVSYSRLDEQIVKSLVHGLEAARRNVWFDDDLEGGEVWWVKILESIQQAEVVIFALSDNALQSKPCCAELDYALALNRTVLPIKVGPVANFRANPLSALQTVEFREDARSAFEIIAAVDDAVKRMRPLPDPMPPLPPLPFAYLASLSKQIDSEELSPTAQIDAVDELRKKYREETDTTVHEDIIAILLKLKGKSWATVQAANEVDTVVAWARSHQAQRTPTDVPPTEPEHRTEAEVDDAERHKRERFEAMVAERLLVQEKERADESATTESEQKPKPAPRSEAHRDQVDQIKRFDRVRTPLPPPRVAVGAPVATRTPSAPLPQPRPLYPGGTAQLAVPAPATPPAHRNTAARVWVVVGVVVLILLIIAAL